MRSIRLLWVLLVVALLGLRATSTARASDCQFVLGFATLADLFPKAVGQCLDNEQHNATNGDGMQHTTGGLLVWRKADNVTAFTNGYDTILNGPQGLEERRNMQRFAWEVNPDGLPVIGYQPAGPAQFASPPGPRLHVTQDTLGTVQGPLRFQLAGSGFSPGEMVTVQGMYTPAFLVATGNPQAPATRQTCGAEALGPVQVNADGAGDFAAALPAAQNFHTSGDYRITATGATSGASASARGGGGTLTQVTALPTNCAA